MPRFNAVDNEIYVTNKGGQKEKVIVVVGGSFSLVGLAREIADVLNRTYDKNVNISVSVMPSSKPMKK